MHTGCVRAGALLCSRCAPRAKGSTTMGRVPAPASPLPVPELGGPARQAVVYKKGFEKAA